MQATGNGRWYDEPRDQAHATLVAVFRTVREESAWRLDADEYHAGLYRASDKPGIRGQSRKGYEYGPATLPYNVCRSAVSTLQSKIAKHRPLPQCLTQRGSWKNQKRARKMTQFLEGEFYRQRIFEKHAKAIIRDALVFGRGALKVWSEGKRIKVERTHVTELYTDPWDDRYETPRNMYHCRSVDKGVALEAFARTESGGWRKAPKDAIDNAGRFDLDNRERDDGGCTVDRVDIIEAWHLCDRPEEHEPEREEYAGDEVEPDKTPDAPPSMGERPKKHKCSGRHVIATTAGTLIDEPWEHDYFPFAILNYDDPLTGFWGYGLVEQLEGYQYEINLSSEKVSEQFRLSGVHILTPDTAKITDQAFRNGISVMRHAAGGVPQVFQMDLVNEHARARPRELTQDGLNDAGISQMSAQSQKPSGITAAVALQTLDDIETERFMVFGRAYETWCLELARRFINCARQIADAYGDHAVSVPMKGGLLDLKWSDVYVDGVEIKIFPTSLLPQQLSARLEKLKMLFDAQILDRAGFLRHLEAPDLQAELDLETADRLVIDEILEKMRDSEEEEGEEAYIPPSAYQSLPWALKRAQQVLNRAMLDDAPEFVLDHFRRFLKDGEELQNKMNPPPPPPAAGAPPMPGGPPPPGMGMAPPPPAAPPMAA